MLWKILVSCGLTNGIAWLLGQSSLNSQNFYKSLIKPEWSPPPYLFGIVWPVLYTFMGYAAYRIYEKKTENPVQAQKALAVFFLQYALNVIWSPIFFGANNIILSGFVIAFLLPCIVWNLTEFYTLDKTAGLLLIPYLSWVTLATLLMYNIVQMNYARFIAT